MMCHSALPPPSASEVHLHARFFFSVWGEEAFVRGLFSKDMQGDPLVLCVNGGDECPG